jgi:hypothetical protein
VGGRTVGRLLTAEHVERYRRWIDSDRRLRQLVKELEALAIKTAEHAEGWTANRRPQAQTGASADPPPVWTPAALPVGGTPTSPQTARKTTK